MKNFVIFLRKGFLVKLCGEKWYRRFDVKRYEGQIKILGDVICEDWG